MKKRNLSLLFLTFFFISHSIIYSQEDLTNLEVLFTIMDPNFPENQINAQRIGENVCHLGDINGDGFDDWAVGLSSAVDYGSGLQTGTVHIHFGGAIPESETPPDMIIGGTINQYGLGAKISGAGDVNNDGYNDLLVKYTQYDGSYENVIPTVALYYGGDPFDDVIDLTFVGVEGHNRFNFGIVSGAGDVNNDDYDDIIIGAPTNITGPDSGHVYLYYGGQEMDNNVDIIFTGDFNPGGPPTGGAHNFGSSISAAGDMNNDGFDDILINASLGAKLYLGGSEMDNIVDVLFNDMTGMGTGPIVSGAGDVNNDGYDDALFGAWYSGTAYLCYGGDTVDNISDIVMPGWADWDYFGRSVSGAGDLNGDGFYDIIVGSDVDGIGMARIYLGSSTMDNIPDIFLFTNINGDRFGYTVSGGGDFDNDGFSDIIVGGIGDYTNWIPQDDQGNISLFYGGESMDAVAEAVFTGITSLPYFGQYVSYAGDVNKDGYPDLIVGEPGYSPGFYYVGRAFLYLGSEDHDDEPDIVFKSDDAAWHYNFGGLVKCAGDVNGDGYSDLFIAETNPNSDDCKSYIHLGGESMDSIPDIRFPFYVPQYRPNGFSALGDINTDGYDDILITNEKAYLFFGGETMDVIPDVTFDNTNESGMSAGDLNGDGYQDLMINSQREDLSGFVKVFFGGSTIDTIPDLILEGEVNNILFGFSMGGGNDINNDGYEDIIISDPYHNVTPDGREGRVYIYYGGEPMDNIPDVTITASKPGNNLGFKVMTLPDLNADGYDEVLFNHGRYYGVYQGSGLYIYYGGDSFDTIPDIFLPYGAENDLSVYSHPTEDYMGIIVGNPDISAVLVYTNASLLPSTQSEERSQNADKYTLHKNYPNPFNSETTIAYQLSEDSKVELSIFNIMGQKQATLVSERQQAGKHTVLWDASSYPEGLYFYRISSGHIQQTRKMILLKK